MHDVVSKFWILIISSSAQLRRTWLLLLGHTAVVLMVQMSLQAYKAVCISLAGMSRKLQSSIHFTFSGVPSGADCARLQAPLQQLLDAHYTSDRTENYVYEKTSIGICIHMHSLDMAHILYQDLGHTMATMEGWTMSCPVEYGAGELTLHSGPAPVQSKEGT